MPINYYQVFVSQGEGDFVGDASVVSDGQAVFFIPEFLARVEAVLTARGDFEGKINLSASYEGLAAPVSNGQATVFVPEFKGQGDAVIASRGTVEGVVPHLMAASGDAAPVSNGQATVFVPEFKGQGESVLAARGDFDGAVPHFLTASGDAAPVANAQAVAVFPEFLVQGTSVTAARGDGDLKGGHIFSSLTQDATWDAVGTAYTDLNNIEVASSRLKAEVRSGDEGILMESGAEGRGLAVVVTNGGTIGQEKILAAFGEGSTITGSGTASLEHQIYHRFNGASFSGDDVTLNGDQRDKVQTEYYASVPGENFNATVTSVSFDASNSETNLTLSQSTATGGTADWTFGPKQVVVGWSADGPNGNAVLWINGTPVDYDTFSPPNNELAGGNNGGIGDKYGSGTTLVRDMGLSWGDSDHNYDNTVYWADLYKGETSDLVQNYNTESLTVDATYDDEGKAYNTLSDGIGKVASARAYVNIDDKVRNGREIGIVAHWGAGVDGAILYGYNGTLYLQVGDGSVQGGSAECQWDITPGDHVIEWTADENDGRLELWVDNVKVDSTTGWSYSGDLAGANEDGIGTKKSATPSHRDSWNLHEGGLRWHVTKALTYEGETFDVAPSFDSTSYTYNTDTGNGSHTADWSGGIPPFDFEIFETSSKSNLIYSVTTSNRSDSDSSYNSPSFTTGDNVYFVLTDDDGQTTATSVFVTITS